MISEIEHLEEKLAAAERDVEGLVKENARLRAKLTLFANLISESHGVAGLHLNGDVAPWSELQPGGRFEGWVPELTPTDVTQPKAPL